MWFDEVNRNDLEQCTDVQEHMGEALQQGAHSWKKTHRPVIPEVSRKSLGFLVGFKVYRLC